MILPTKHLQLNETILGAGAIVLANLERSQTVSGLWEKVKKDPKIANFKYFTLVLDLLFALGAIEMNGRIIKKGARR